MGEREGRTLADYLAEHGRIPLGEGLAVLDELLRIVGEGHRQGTVDGAIVPERVLIGPAAKVQLLAASDAGAPADTESYRSPQQCSGAAADARADVYALGVIAYRTLLGAPPYAAEGSEPTDPVSFLPNLVDHVRRSLLIAVQRNLTDRFADALTFRAALRGDSDLALASPTLKWAVPEGIPEGDTGAAEEFADEDVVSDSATDAGDDTDDMSAPLG